MTIATPERGITLADGWWLMVLYAGKSTENRARGTAARLRGWRGTLLLSASKACDLVTVGDNVKCMKDLLGDAWTWTGSKSFYLREVAAAAGHAVGVVDVVDAKPNGPSSGPWAAPGQDGLVLANPRPIKRVPFCGGRGVWYPGKCPLCGALQTRENANDNMCRRCKKRVLDWHVAELELQEPV